MHKIVAFAVPSVFSFCRRVGRDGRVEVLQDLTAGDVLSALEDFPTQAVKSRALSGN